MRKVVFTIVGAALIAASSAQIASAHEHHHVRKAVTWQFRNANANANAPVPYFPDEPAAYSGGWSAPAGH